MTLISEPGYCRLALPSRDADATGDVAEIASMYVAPADQGQGVGSALMRAAFELAAGYRDVTLWVWERNAPARRFYERCGFVADGARQDDPGTGLVDVRMRREVQGASG